MDVHGWFDDIFTGTDSVKNHNERLLWVYTCLKDEQLYISKKKFDPFAPVLDILGCKVDAHGVHADSDKLAKLRDWHTPKDHTEVLHFLGLIEYLAHFLPNISAYTGPLQTICKKNLPFRWSPLQQKCFEQIKVIACETLILKPICWDILPNTTGEDKPNYKVWVITDACPASVGVVLAQGADWKTSRLASFMSKKFTATQCGYFGYELEALGVLKALTKWLDELTGSCKFMVVTDHKALTYFKAKQHTTGCHIRWQNFFHGFNCDIIYIEGNKNKVTDTLSWYYESSSSEDVHYDDLVSVDIKIDKNGEDLPLHWAEEAWDLLNNFKGSIAFAPMSLSASDEVEKHQIEAEGIDPPEESIGRSELPLTELIKTANSDTVDSDVLQCIKTGYSSYKAWVKLLKHLESCPEVSSSHVCSL